SVLECHLDVGQAAENDRLRRPEHRGRLAQRLVHRLRLREPHCRLVDKPFGFCHAVSLTLTFVLSNSSAQASRWSVHSPASTVFLRTSWLGGRGSCRSERPGVESRKVRTSESRVIANSNPR